MARRLKRGIDDGSDQFDVFNECQDHVLAAARAHVDTLILEAFTRAVDGCEDDEIAKLLDDLRRLHALTTIERERGWYFEHGRMTGPRSKARHARGEPALQRSCATTPTLLVDAFAIPDTQIAAPIGLRNRA